MEGCREENRHTGRLGRPLRLVRMLDSLGRMGGLERQALKVLNRLIDYGYEIHLITPGKAGQVALEMLDDRIALHEMGYDPSKRRNVRSYLQGYRLLKKLKPDIFMGSLGANYRGRPAAILAGVPVIIAEIASYRPTGSLSVRMRDKLFAGKTDVFICNSQGVTDAEKLRIGRNDIRVQLVYSNIDIEEIQQAAEKPANLREAIGAAPGAVLFIAVGTFRWEKAYDILLKAWAGLGLVPQQAHLVIVGAGSLFEEMKALAENLAITNTVTFAGWREDVPSLMKEADVFVMSSISEGAPNVLLEAGALRLPRVSSNPNGSNISQYMADGETGLIVEPGSFEQLAAGMKKLLNMTPQERQAMGDRAYEHVAQNFAFGRADDSVAQLDQICRQILTAKGRL